MTLRYHKTQSRIETWSGTILKYERTMNTGLGIPSPSGRSGRRDRDVRLVDRPRKKKRSRTPAARYGPEFYAAHLISSARPTEKFLLPAMLATAKQALLSLFPHALPSAMHALPSSRNFPRYGIFRRALSPIEKMGWYASGGARQIERHTRRERRDVTEEPRSLECRATRRGSDHVTLLMKKKRPIDTIFGGSKREKGRKRRCRGNRRT